jgi:acyl carrier protein
VSATPNDAALRAAIVAALLDVAPDIDAAALDHATPIRAQFDFDSMDLLSFVTALHVRFGVDVPESDYVELASVDGCVRYLAAHGARAS